jgi:hypothetical protein
MAMVLVGSTSGVKFFLYIFLAFKNSLQTNVPFMIQKNANLKCRMYHKALKENLKVVPKVLCVAVHLTQPSGQACVWGLFWGSELFCPLHNLFFPNQKCFELFFFFLQYWGLGLTLACQELCRLSHCTSP